MKTQFRSAIVLLGIASAQVWGATLVDVTVGSTIGATGFYGQSVTTPAGGPWNSIRFNWYLQGDTPHAVGTLYLLSQEYLGAPGVLSAATTGFLASSTGISAGEFVFDAAVQLAAGTQYFFYGDTVLVGIEGNGDTYAGGAVYFTPAGDFAAFDQDADFRLSGVAVPEPASFLICGLGLAAIVLRRRI